MAPHPAGYKGLASPARNDDNAWVVAPPDAAASADSHEELREGTVYELTGIARSVGPLATSPLSGEACIYWEELEGFASKPSARSENMTFWLESDRGRVMVDVNDALLLVRAERTKDMGALADNDVHEVGLRLRKRKTAARTLRGHERQAAQRQVRQLKKLATLLCAIRAHAKGNVHVGGTLEGQQKYIKERGAKLKREGVTSTTLGLIAERYEVLICEGQQLKVRGACRRGSAPAGSGSSNHYREAPSCLWLCAPPDGPLKVQGLGAIAPRSPKERLALTFPEQAAALKPASKKFSVPYWLWACFAAVIYFTYRAYFG